MSAKLQQILFWSLQHRYLLSIFFSTYSNLCDWSYCINKLSLFENQNIVSSPDHTSETSEVFLWIFSKLLLVFSALPLWHNSSIYWQCSSCSACFTLHMAGLVYMCVCLCVYMYTQIYIQTHTYTYIYIWIVAISPDQVFFQKHPLYDPFDLHFLKTAISRSYLFIAKMQIVVPYCARPKCQPGGPSACKQILWLLRRSGFLETPLTSSHDIFSLKLVLIES